MNRARRLIGVIVVATAGCVAAAHRAGAPAADIPAIRAELIDMGVADQRERDGFGAAIAANDSVYAKRLITADSARSRRLREIVASVGWPGAKQFGREAAGSAWLILQHSPYHDLQRGLLPRLEAAAKTGDIRLGDVAMLTDRILVNEGKPQRYASSFAITGGRMIPHPIEDLAKVDSLRASVGLEPMSEYVKHLAEMFNLPVDWPPK